MRIALNGAQSHRTLSGRFLSEFFGSGVQHIAFASADIFASAEALQAAGVESCRSRTTTTTTSRRASALRRSFSSGCEQRRLLYDRDDAGEYFQLYTAPFADRFFFEIVERRGGYRGFGAANAPIRLAAQARSKNLFCSLPMTVPGLCPSALRQQRTFGERRFLAGRR